MHGRIVLREIISSNLTSEIWEILYRSAIVFQINFVNHLSEYGYEFFLINY